MENMLIAARHRKHPVLGVPLGTANRAYPIKTLFIKLELSAVLLKGILLQRLLEKLNKHKYLNPILADSASVKPFKKDIEKTRREAYYRQDEENDSRVYEKTHQN